jgi:competence protein ComEC
VRLLDVMVLGQRSTADQKLNEAFLRAGGMHFLAVSGFNVAVLATAAWWATRRVLGRGGRTAAGITIVLVVLFTLVTEPNAPILRGAIGVILAALARATRRPICAINCLALAAMAILLFNPQELFRAGFQLTFIQVLVLITVVPRVYHAVFRRRSDEFVPREPQTTVQLAMSIAGRGAAGLLIVCICTWASATPLVLLHFGRWAPWGWLGTVPLTPLVTFVTLLSIVTLAANAVLPPCGVLLGFALRQSTDFLLWTVGLFSHLPATLVECQPPPAWIVGLTYGLLLIFVAWRGSRRYRSDTAVRPLRSAPIVRGSTLVKTVTVAVLALAWIGWLVFPARARGGGYALHVLDVGNGSAAVLTTAAGQAVVFDVGTDTNSDAGETVVRALHALRIQRVEAALISHDNFDHFSGLPTLLQGVPVQDWLVSPYFPRQPGQSKPLDHLFRLLPRNSPAPGVLRAGQVLTVGDVILEVLWPPEGLDPSYSANDRSLVIRISAAGRSVLVPGDIEKNGLRRLLDEDRAGRISLRADVLVAPHHGSLLKDVTADFYAAVSPRIVLVSSRRPREKLEALVGDVLGPAARTLLTGQLGAVAVRITPAGELLLETPYAHSE